MQAIILFAMFGVFMATISGIISSGSETTRQIMLNRETQVRSFFRDAENILRNRVTYQEMQIAATNLCDGSTANPAGGVYNVIDPQPYLCRMEIRQLASWDMGAPNPDVRITDPWRNDIRGVVARRMMSVGPGVLAPVTVMAFISAGPDRVLSPNLANALQNARNNVAGGVATANDMRSILSLSADLDRNAGIQTDDIVHVFSNLTTQQARWDKVANNVERVFVAMQESYMAQYDAFLPDLRAYYNSGGVAFLTDINAWKTAPLAGKPTLSVPNLNTTAGQLSLGIDDAFDAIRQPAPSGSSMTVNHAWDSTIGGVTDSFDRMTLTLTNNGSPWTVGFSRTMDMAP